MAEKTKELLVAGLSGILGVVVGAVSAGIVNYVTLERQQRKQAVIDSFKFDYGDYPKDIFDLKIFIDKTRSLSTASPEEIARLAEIKRKYPNCTTTLGKDCLGAVVEGIQAARKEMGVGEAKPEDIEILIKDFFLKAQQASKVLNE